MRLDPTSLKLFISVVELGTIAAAAEQEHIAAAAVSKRISELEENLGIRLLTRTNKGIHPTPAGFALSTMARRALHELDEVAVRMREYVSGLRGFVRVFANISAITQFLPRDIRDFLGEYPNVQVDLEEKITPAIIKAVAENAADVGIFSGTVPDHDVEILPYREDMLALVVPAMHPLQATAGFRFVDALEYDFIGLHRGSAINRILSHAASGAKRTVKLKVQVTGFDALCFMVDSGLGVGVLPLDLAQRYAAIFNIRIIALTEPWARRKIQICVRAFDALPTAAKLFVDHLSRPQM
ncbi:LysR substrate-binding domain-containing protein [Bordetella holmesii]|uniref:LysR substrate-binding domain protein n=2 Tax=Bordetella holmesii TaxID=35814 RepID=A0A158M9Q5_9BORD|nr:LysR substrate-binding domain-containing protein [Bordetella holmesii]AHV94640.1 bacterial regulatory helix-turn-helix, lysR family protein [Bordetella holmesii ATCC 51541]AIT25841.1 bacterial regulatory helix-turn-helix, lysR family protein [Bordetella holmesii 44057]EWM43968.1 bacterial regulatory helix-turn-helix, lysR family protein [Bordetella holmesii 41130]EWM46410.1 bacterial regulatory helix-turn-helix, lysR family protein [Bordetella holmesii 35009]EWM50572.1 bacterial regulatory 